jgi:hypothetical protein
MFYPSVEKTSISQNVIKGKMVIVHVREGTSASAVNVRIDLVEELRFHIVMGWMERMILNGIVISYSCYGRVMEFAEL